MPQARRLARLWRHQSFMERKLKSSKGKTAFSAVKWRELDVEGVCCMEKDIYIGANDRILHFRDLKLVKTHSLPEDEKLKFFYVSDDLILLVLNAGNCYRLLRREGLELLRKWR